MRTVGPPDLESLRCFVAAATHLRFRSAAEACSLSPTAFSTRIRALETQLGAELFARTTRTVRLTEAGERLLVQARATLDAAAQCAHVVHQADVAPFEVTLGTRFELGLSFIVPALSALERKRPSRRLHLYFADSADLIARILRGDIDAAVASMRLNDARLAYAPLHEEQYVLVGAKKLLAKKPLVMARDAAAHTLLDVHSDLPLFRYLLDARPASEAWSFARIEHLGAIGAVRARALEGVGVAVLPRYFVDKELREGKLSLLMPRTKLATDWFRLVWRTGHSYEARLRELAADLAALPLR
jgi:DNA-binding transcriptional LysR family regulator